jgi:PAS domain S-box-containing protein
MSQWFIELFNLIANAATVAGIVVAIYVLMQVRRIAVAHQKLSARLEQVIAPKTGIEGFLNTCAQVVENDPDGTCIVADDGEIILVNRRMEQLSGYHRSELLGRQVEILVPDMYRGVHPTHRDNYLVTAENRPMRGLSLRHKRGRDIPVGIELGHYADASGGYTIAKVRAAAGSDSRTSGAWAK